MPSVFKYKEDWVNVQGSDKSARTLIPNEEGNVIDVVQKFPWTLTPRNSPARTETPYIKLKEFYLLDTYINQLLKSYNITAINPSGTAFQQIEDALSELTDLGVIATANDDRQLYEKMYDHINPTGFEYRFPYFESSQTNVNTWTQKSTYDFIVYYQQKLASFNLFDELRSDDFGGYFDPTYFLNVVTGFFNPDVLNAGFNFIQGQPSTQDLGTLGGASFQRASYSRLPVAGTLIEVYEKVAKAYYEAKRKLELIDIALTSSMGNLQGDPVIDKPLIWTTSQPRNFVISFPLFNTDFLDDNSGEKTITRNWELCYLLAYQNLYNKKNLFKGTPPVFYEIEVPGVHYTKAGYVNDLKILNIGNTRLLDLPIGSNGERRSVNVPDAYFVVMSLIDFFMPSKNFLDSINNPTVRNRVKASGDPYSGYSAPDDTIPDDLPDFPSLPSFPTIPGIPGFGFPGFIPGFNQPGGSIPDPGFNQPGGSTPDPGFNRPGGTGGIEFAPGATTIPGATGRGS